MDMHDLTSPPDETMCSRIGFGASLTSCSSSLDPPTGMVIGQSIVLTAVRM